MSARAVATAGAAVLLTTVAAGIGAGETEGAEAGPVARGSIVGGRTADFEDWRFTAALFYRKRFICGGAVIGPTTVITAAHCAKGVKLRKLKVVTGRPKLKKTSQGERHGVVAKRIHPDFARTQRHDLAVLTLADPTSETPVELLSEAEDATLTAPGQVLRVAGWGARDRFAFFLPGYLKETREQVLRGRRCRRTYGKRAFAGGSMICAQGRRIPRARGVRTQPCAGDSGGPLVAETPDGPRLAGVVSFGGFVCGDPRSPTAYARVADGLDFIGPP